MAKAIFNFPGMRISGKLNGIVYKIRNGKMYASAPPVRTSKPSENELSVRNNFSFASKLTCSLQKAAHSCEAWRNQVKKSQTVYNAIFSGAFKMIHKNDITHYFSVYPNFAIRLDEDSVKIEEGCIKASLKNCDLVNNARNPFKYVQMSLVVYCKEPLQRVIPDKLFINLNSKVRSVSQNGTFDFDINLFGDSPLGECFSDSEKALYSSYDNHTYFIAFTALNGDKEYVDHTETLSFINIR